MIAHKRLQHETFTGSQRAGCPVQQYGVSVALGDPRGGALLINRLGARFQHPAPNKRACCTRTCAGLLVLGNYSYVFHCNNEPIDFDARAAAAAEAEAGSTGASSKLN